ncbi:MAG: M15 family metallopeptidase [Synechococcaceae cyanobacterium]|nr:M15 family metallopeptidase [Synechococcaceae cyanobacterium]
MLLALPLLAPVPASPLRCSGDGLVSLQRIAPRPLLEIRYASGNNFMREALYPRPRALLRCPVALALQQVQQDLAGEGLALKIWDAYRPLPVQQRMWDRIRDPRYVSDPAANAGRHTRGTAVDVTLVTSLGQQLPMPSDFDEFSERARAEPPTGSPEQVRNALRLRRAMERRGFVVFPSEWWHFDWSNWLSYPPLADPDSPAASPLP